MIGWSLSASDPPLVQGITNQAVQIMSVDHKIEERGVLVKHCVKQQGIFLIFTRPAAQTQRTVSPQ